jgi:hypothetical protein
VGNEKMGAGANLTDDFGVYRLDLNWVADVADEGVDVI